MYSVVSDKISNVDGRFLISIRRGRHPIGTPPPRLHADGCGEPATHRGGRGSERLSELNVQSHEPKVRCRNSLRVCLFVILSFLASFAAFGGRGSLLLRVSKRMASSSFFERSTSFASASYLILVRLVGWSGPPEASAVNMVSDRFRVGEASRWRQASACSSFSGASLCARSHGGRLRGRLFDLFGRLGRIWRCPRNISQDREGDMAALFVASGTGRRALV